MLGLGIAVDAKAWKDFVNFFKFKDLIDIPYIFPEVNNLKIFTACKNDSIPNLFKYLTIVLTNHNQSMGSNDTLN